MRSRPGTPLQHVPSRRSSGRISQPWLTLARGAWVVCALLLLANFVASISAYFQLLQTVCTLPDPSNCATGQLTPDTALALTSLHLSQRNYAASFVILEVVLSLLPWGLGLLIFWRKSDEWMGLFGLAAARAFWWYRYREHALRALGGYSAASAALHPAQFCLGCRMDWSGGLSLNVPDGTICPTLVLARALVLDFDVCVEFVPTFLAAGPPSSGTAVGIAGGLWRDAFIMVYRYVRVFDGVQRQQAKWFVYAAVISLCLLFLGTGLPGVVPADSPSQLLFPIIILFSSALFYLGLGFAILRYRLWDIDAIINRTLVYGSLTILLGLVYVGLIFALQYLLRGFINQDNGVAIVVSTLAIAALFQPLRHRLQRVIDRRFYRRKYDAIKTLEAFSATLRNEVELTQLREHLVAVVQETMQPAHVSLWLRPSEHDRTRQAPWRATPLLMHKMDEAMKGKSSNGNEAALREPRWSMSLLSSCYP